MIFMLTYLNSNYNVTKFELSQKNFIKNSIGVYRIVALPFNFSLNNQEIENFIYEYMKIFRLNYISNTDKKMKSISQFNNGKFINKILLENKLNNNKFHNLKNINNEEFYHKIKRIIHFLPSLYVGQVKDQTFKTRFIQHLNKDNENSLINKINNEIIFKKSLKFFIYLELEKDIIDFIESFLIQTTNPIFNEQRS
jgi:hypothetical protein